MEVVVDSRRGHIALVREGTTVLVFTDLGPVIQVWQYEGGLELDPASAYELGAALTTWADRKIARMTMAPVSRRPSPHHDVSADAEHAS